MDLIKIGDLVMKLQDRNKTLVRAHKLNNGKYAITYPIKRDKIDNIDDTRFYGEFEKDVALKIFNMKVHECITQNIIESIGETK